MIQEYIISGMTCQNCVARVKGSLESMSDVIKADVQLEAPQLVLETKQAIQLNALDNTIGKYGIQHFSPIQVGIIATTEEEESKSFLETYKPLLLIVFFILLTTLLAQFPFSSFNGILWMRHFMAGFFIVFSFFKFLNLAGFAESYAMYDVVAARWNTWGYIYPFVELGLGLLYLTNLFPTFTNVATIIILGISSIGVIQSNLSKRKIKCACLGDVFNLPMSTVTIVEDVSMVVMAVVMLVIGLN